MNHDTPADLEAQKSLLWVLAACYNLPVNLSLYPVFSRLYSGNRRHFRRSMLLSLPSSANEIGISAPRKRVINESLSKSTEIRRLAERGFGGT